MVSSSMFEALVMTWLSSTVIYTLNPFKSLGLGVSFGSVGVCSDKIRPCLPLWDSCSGRFTSGISGDRDGSVHGTCLDTAVDL